MEERDEFQDRLKIVEELRKLGVNPFVYNYERKDIIGDLVSKYSSLKSEEKKEDVKVKIAGRIRGVREHGKLIFADLEDFSGRIQLCLRFDSIGKEKFDFFKKYFDIGDVVGAEGFVFKTVKGELSVWVEKYELLTKSLRGLPSSWFGLKDVETRYRKRYLDLLMNPEVKEVFKKRTEIINGIREFMRSKGYVEVETPIMQPLYGGALAKPFITHHNALNRKMYLRISNEMYLKRLIAGGFEKVFEFSPDFRNESIDTSHNPEFLMMEAMTAYSDYKDGMKLFEQLIEAAAKKALGTTKVKRDEQEADFKTPWEKLTIVEAVKKHVGIDCMKMSIDELVEFAEKHKLELLEKKPTRGELIAAIFEELIEPKLIQPTIIYDFPIEVSPLAKKCRDNPGFTERFEVYVFGKEIGNNYTEITDPVELRNNFKYQLKRGEAGDEESHPMDEDFLTAMEHGMPPTCGIGIGIDRLVIFLTSAGSIRDVIFFPQLRKTDEEAAKEEVFGDETATTVFKHPHPKLNNKKK